VPVEATGPKAKKVVSIVETVPAPAPEPVVDAKPAPSPAPSPLTTPAPTPPAPVAAAKIKPTGVLRKKGVALAGKSAELAESNESKVIEEENVVDPSWTEEPTQEKVKKAWDEFVDIKRKEYRVSLVSSLTMCEVVLDGFIVKFEVKNTLQEEQLNSERAGLLFHLRQGVKCANLELAISLEKEQDDAPKVFLTDKEKYLQMAEKNPALEDLRKRLDLDLA
jgi:hypothetical protein